MQPAKKEEYDITCSKVSKNFFIFDTGKVWDIFFKPSQTQVHEALSEISLHVPKGEFVGILGRNGSGKSTLLRTIGGVFSPSSGVISLSGALSSIYELGVTGSELMLSLIHI